MPGEASAVAMPERGVDAINKYGTMAASELTLSSQGWTNASMCASVRNSIIGDDMALPSAVGPRKVTYCDSTASGRASRLIEDVMMSQVLPMYANTHTTTSFTGFSAQHFLDEGRSVAREWLRAADKDHVVLFTGRGATEASNRLVHYLLGPAVGRNSLANATGASVRTCLYPGCGRTFADATGLQLHARQHTDGEGSLVLQKGLEGRHGTSAATPAHDTDAEAPATVLVGPRAHHSSFLPFLAVGCVVRHLPEPSDAEAASGLGVSMQALLQGMVGHYVSNPGKPLICVFTFASNVTGDSFSEPGASRVTAAVHAMGGVNVWDCAASAPHAPPVVDPHVSLGWTDILGGPEVEEQWRAAPKAANLLGKCQRIAAAVTARNATLPGAGGITMGGSISFSTMKDAVFFSMHKLVGGGAGSPGLLCLRRTLLGGARATPAITVDAQTGSVTDSSKNGSVGSAQLPPGPYLPGGGTVFFVDANGRPTFLGQDAEREEGGTPDVCGAARAGLMLHLFRSVGAGTILSREQFMAEAARAVWALHPRIRVFGQGDTAGHGMARMPIVSISILAGEAGASSPSAGPSSSAPPLSLHYGLLCAMLNDLFGIQARGGCLCAGVYAQQLLGMSTGAADALLSTGGAAGKTATTNGLQQASPSDQLLSCLVNGRDELLRPGFVRLSFTYHQSMAEFDHVVRSVLWLADHALELLGAGLYTAVAETGEWRLHRAKAATLLAAAYRRHEQEDGGATTSAAAQGQARQQSPRDVIARFCPALSSVLAQGTTDGDEESTTASTSDAGVLALEEAARGGAKAPQRPWLQAILFPSSAYSSVSAAASGELPLRSPSSSTAGPSSVMGGGPHRMLPRQLLPITARSTEEQCALFGAYRAEASMMVDTLRSKGSGSGSGGAGSSSGGGGRTGTPLTVPGWSGSEANQLSAAGLLSPEAQPLRWFVLPEDLDCLDGARAGAGSQPGSPGAVNGSCRVALSADARAATGPAAMFPHPPHILRRCVLFSLLASIPVAGQAGYRPTDGMRTMCLLVASYGLGRVLSTDTGALAALQGLDTPALPATTLAQLRAAVRTWDGSAGEGSTAVAGAGVTNVLDTTSSAASPSPSHSIATPSSTTGYARGSAASSHDNKPAPSLVRGTTEEERVRVMSVEPTKDKEKASKAAATPAEQKGQGKKAGKDKRAAAVETSGSTGAEVSSAPAPATGPAQPGGTVLSASPSPLEGYQLTPLEYVWRRARLEATTAALSAVPRPAPSVTKAIAHGLKRAILQFGMIKHGDRVLVGLSGGKDSMTLLLELLRLQALAPVWFEVGAATVDPQYEGAYDPGPLAAWCSSLGIEYTIEAAPVLELAGTKMDKDSLCAFCSRLKRGILYGACRRRGYNVLALGQHADDFAESFVMSVFQNGLMRTMKAHYANEAGDVRIIRPLCYVRERDTRAYAHAAMLPVIPENCPGCFSAPQVRYATKKLLAREEAKNPTIFSSISQAIQPLMITSGAQALRVAGAVAAGEAPPEPGAQLQGGDDGEDDDAPPVSVAGNGSRAFTCQTVEDEIRGVAPAGFVPATLLPPSTRVPAKAGDRGAEEDSTSQADATAEAEQPSAVFAAFCGGEDDFA